MKYIEILEEKLLEAGIILTLTDARKAELEKLMSIQEDPESYIEACVNEFKQQIPCKPTPVELEITNYRRLKKDVCFYESCYPKRKGHERPYKYHR